MVPFHLVLIGLPGAGKTTVGRRAATDLGAPFIDLDEAIALVEGATISDIIGTRGEPEFRNLERLAMREALSRDPAIIAAGGGWAAQPGNLEAARGRALTLYLYTGPATAAQRIAGTADRPLLGRDMLTSLRALFADREPFYRRADAVIRTEGRPVAAVAEDVVALARAGGGW